MIDINEYRNRKNKSGSNSENNIDDDDNAFFEGLRKLIDTETPYFCTMNPDAVNNFEHYCSLLNTIVDGAGIRMDCGIDKDCPDLGYVKIVGRKILISDPTLFSEIAQEASCLEIYPKTDGKIEIDFGFYGLTLNIN